MLIGYVIVALSGAGGFPLSEEIYQTETECKIVLEEVKKNQPSPLQCLEVFRP